MEGAAIEKNQDRAVRLLKQASAAGSAIATYNLGVLAQDNIYGSPNEALNYFRKAARTGEPRGYRAAAILLDEGRGTPKNPAEAAELLLLGIASDPGGMHWLN
jgi:hypothetical protein